MQQNMHQVFMAHLGMLVGSNKSLKSAIKKVIKWISKIVTEALREVALRY